LFAWYYQTERIRKFSVWMCYKNIDVDVDKACVSCMIIALLPTDNDGFGFEVMSLVTLTK